MSEKQRRTVGELFANRDLVTAAIQRGVRDALLAHARAGRSVPISENGHVVWLSPEEIFQRYPDAPVASSK